MPRTTVIAHGRVRLPARAHSPCSRCTARACERLTVAELSTGAAGAAITNYAPDNANKRQGEVNIPADIDLSVMDVLFLARDGSR